MARRQTARTTLTPGHRPTTRSMNKALPPRTRINQPISRKEKKKSAREPKLEKASTNRKEHHVAKRKTKSPKPTMEKVNLDNQKSKLPAPSENQEALSLPSEPARDVTREALLRQGWDAETCPEHLRYCSVSRACRLPSPLVKQGDWQEDVPLVISDHVHRSVRHIFKQIYKNRESLRPRILQPNRQSGLDFGGAVCTTATDRKGKRKAIAVEEYPIKIYDSSIQAANQLSIELDELSSAQADTSEGDPNAGKSLEIRRLSNVDGQSGYFILSTDLELLAVNESAIGHGVIAGPLPEFALITVAHVALFWWSYGKSTDLAAQQGTKRKLDNPAEKPPERISWQQLLDKGLREWRLDRSSNHKKNPKRHVAKIPSINGWAVDDVLLAVACVWEGLRYKGRLFAYAGQDVFDPDELKFEFPGTQYGVVGGQNKFIMPLLFPSKDQSAAKKATKAAEILGHLLLCVAEVGNDLSKSGQKDPGQIKDSDMNNAVEELKVRTTIYDSAPGHVRPDSLQANIKVLIKKWLDPKRWRIGSYQVYSTPQQADNDTCGFHTVLSAWAVMLDIPIHSGSERRETDAAADFYEQGKEMVNLAIAGCMDSTTIQAFMNVHGFSVDQDPNDPSCRVEDLNVSRMDLPKLQRCLSQQRDADHLAAHGERDDVITDEKVAAVRHVLGPDKEANEITNAIVLCGGDAAAAVRRLVDPDGSPSPPFKRRRSSRLSESSRGSADVPDSCG